MNSELKELQSLLNALYTKYFILILNKIYTKKYFTYFYHCLNSFKVKALAIIVYQNKYFNAYNQLYTLRNVFIKSDSIYKHKKFILKQNLYHWYFQVYHHHIQTNNINFAYIERKNKIKGILSKFFLLKILNKKGIKINIIEKYFLLLLKNYLYETDKLYIKSLTLVKSIYSYVIHQIKILKVEFLCKIANNKYTQSDLFNINRYILINYLKYNKNSTETKRIKNLLLSYKIDNDRECIDSLLKKEKIENYSLTHSYNDDYKNKLINKNITNKFNIWKNQIDFQKIFLNRKKNKFEKKNIISRLFILLLVIKKALKKHFNIFYNNIYSNNKIILTHEKFCFVNAEVICNNYMINILRGMNKIHNFKNSFYSRAFEVKDKNKKIIVFNKWLNIINNGYKEKYIECENYITNKNKSSYNIIFDNCINIRKAILILDGVFRRYLEKYIYNRKAILFVNLIFKEQLKKIYMTGLLIIGKIIRKNIQKYCFKLYIRKNIIINPHRSIKQNHIRVKHKLSFFIIVISNILIKNQKKAKIYFFDKIKNIDKLKKHLLISKLTKILSKISTKQNYKYSLYNCFIHWYKPIKNIPQSSLTFSENSINNSHEILNMQKYLKEDQDFHDDLKTKISALEQENQYLGLKIVQITQRVEKCEKCSTLLCSSTLSMGNIMNSFDNNLIKNINDNNNIKSRNIEKISAAGSSGLNFVTGGTDLVPRKPQGTLNIYEDSDESIPNSNSFDDLGGDEDEFKDVDSSPYLAGLKQKIMDLKNEKEPIVNKLRKEIDILYQELNGNNY